jgi:hypothetical protein
MLQCVFFVFLLLQLQLNCRLIVTRDAKKVDEFFIMKIVIHWLKTLDFTV